MTSSQEQDSLACTEKVDDDLIESLVFKAKQGSKEAREEIYLRLQPVFQKVASVYHYKSKKKVEIGDFLHEIYVTTERAISCYDKSQGRFMNYLRALTKNNLVWLIQRMKNIENTTKRYTFNIDDCSAELKLHDCIADPDALIIDEITSRFDYEKVAERIKKYVDNTYSPLKKEIFNLIFIKDLNPLEVAKKLNIPTKNVYTNIILIKKNLRLYCERHYMLLPEYIKGKMH
ncbi:MAG TPA: hypothetical protein DCY93_00455 [Firmicutes bacterium]|nr:hypothetical protein [Bacillota bacterium]